jgi:hypothetical protein
MRDLVRIEYHPPCTFYGEEGCIEQTGEYECACGASTAWHKTEPVEIDDKTAVAAADAFNHEMLRITGNEAAAVEMRAIYAALNAALGIGGDKT